MHDELEVAQMLSRKNDMDMTCGPFFKKLLVFSIPLVLSGVLQLLYNAADLIVVGQYAGQTAVAAVGSTGSLTNLIVNVFLGLSVGVSVTVAISLGAHDSENTNKLVHTAVTTSLIGGVILAIVGFFCSRTFLIWMDTPDDVIDQASIYLQIYFLGMPANLFYNYGSAIMRTTGDTSRPLYILAASGLVNVILNILLVKYTPLDVEGVAIATVVSQILSAVATLYCLIKYNNDCKLYLSKLRIHKAQFLRILRIGIPAGIQGSIFSLSNVIIQSSVNSFGSAVMAGNSAASNLEGFVYTGMNSFYQASVTFTGQNVGAKKLNNIKPIWLYNIAMVMGIWAILSGGIYLFRYPLLALYLPDAPESVSYGILRMQIIFLTYFLCGLMEVTVGSTRGMGASLAPMLMSIIGVCGSRILWIFTIFKFVHTLEMLYISYPVSWLVTFLAQVVGMIIVKRRLVKHIDLDSVTEK